MGQQNRKRMKSRAKGSGYKYDESFKKRVASHYLNSDHTLMEIGKMYNVRHQAISDWAYEFFGEIAEGQTESDMQRKKQPKMAETTQNDSIEKQLISLKKELEYERMKVFALETMIDLAKTELGVDVRKNSGAKQPKR
jgi:predicted DNA-binding protein YlxM (UPF0122 family)